MKKTILALVMTLLLPQAVMAAPQAKQDAAISTSINQLGYQLLGKLANKNNLIISPLSIFEALSLAREGASGDTLKEFDQCMHLKTSPVSDLTALNGELARGSAKLEANQAITLEQQKVKLTLPKFVIEGSENIEQKMPQLGLKKAFLADQADFGKMTGAKGQSKNKEPLYIGQILHKTFLEVDEAGTEAAAVTVISMPGGAAPSPTKPVEMVVDRPFVLTIRDRQSNTNLFVGLVYNPNQK